MTVYGKCDLCGEWTKMSLLENVIEKQGTDRLTYKACPHCVEHAREIYET